jgi:hypothetical protein
MESEKKLDLEWERRRRRAQWELASPWLEWWRQERLNPDTV